jgi:ABC-type amino acid transport substrate-binding protein
MTRSLLILFASAVASLAGCNDTHVTITGNVTASGQPLPQGQIEFSSTDGGGTPVGASIKAGKYTARMLPGEKTVVITETFDIPAPTSTEELQRAAAEGKAPAPPPVSKIKPTTKGNSIKVNVTKQTKTLDFPLEP